MLIPDGFAQANIRFSGLGLPYGAEVTLGLSVALFAGDAQDAADAFAAAYTDTVNQQISSAVSADSVLVKFGPNETGQSAEAVLGGSGPLSSESTSPAVALLIRKQTASGGRQGRGRMFHPGVLEDDVSPAGVIDTTVRTNFQVAFDDFYDQLVAADLGPVVLHSEQSPAASPVAITSFQVQGIVATQRKRQRR